MQHLTETVWPLTQDEPAEQEQVKLMLGEGEEYREYFAILAHGGLAPAAPGAAPGEDFGSQLARTMVDAEAWAARAGQMIDRTQFWGALGPQARQVQKLTDAMFSQRPPQ
ncbi:MAG: hypothetical protein WDZ46_01200 [Solirubrobacterales bacterium]